MEGAVHKEAVVVHDGVGLEGLEEGVNLEWIEKRFIMNEKTSLQL